MTPGLTLLNLGLGRDSLTMLCLIKEGTLPVPDAVVFADTGAEWPHTYALLPRVADLCAEIGVPFYHLAKPSPATSR